jgi:Fe-S oxidoreductase
MDLIKLRDIKETCIRDEPVFCSNSCPLGVDVRELAARISRSDFSGAYKLYRKQVVFPHIVSMMCDEPCRNSCIRSDIDEPISIRLLERSCCEQAKKNIEPAYYMPAKNKVVAVIGAGLGGLSCAVKLALKGYEVNLYEKQASVVSWLIEHDAVNSTELYGLDIEQILKTENLAVHLQKEVRSLNHIEFDAAYIATGIDGRSFKLTESFDPVSLATAEKGVFISGRTAGQPEYSVLIPLRQGISVSQSIENFLKTGNMGGKAGEFNIVPSRLYVDTKTTIKSAAVKPVNKQAYSASEAVKEADRCLLCECSVCINSCELLDFYNKKPKKIIDDISASLNVVTTTRVASRQINSCNLCGLCNVICPTGLDFEEVFLSSRRALYKGGNLPPAFHDFWIRDMDFSNSEEAFLFINPPQSKSKRYLFFPGCQLGASDPRYVTDTYDYLKKNINGSISLMLGCCGAPAEWAGQEEKFTEVIAMIREHWQKAGCPELILTCPTCIKMFATYLGDLPRHSLWSIMGRMDTPHKANERKFDKFTVFDACASRNDIETRNSVRKLIQNSGYAMEELDYSGGQAKCCGYGGQIHAVNPLLLDRIVSNRVSDSPLDYITYCTNCRDTFANAGKRAFHILDLLFRADEIQKRALRKPPTLTQRRNNRRGLKRDLLKINGGAVMPSQKNEFECVKVAISEEIYEKMDQDLIVLEDVQRTIHHCEKTGEKVLDRATGNIAGHLQSGYITYWVVYQPVKDGFKLVDVYSHRLVIEEEK